MKKTSINRRDFLSASTCILGGVFLNKVKTDTPPPNVVLILIDDLGWKDLGCYGSSIFETPNIDQLSLDGMRFTQAYANCPVCSPSRAALMTGKNPARLQFTGHITAIGRHRHPEHSRIIPPDDHMNLPLNETSIAEALKPAGYVSASIGKWHLGTKKYWPETQGFDKNIGGWTHGSPPDYFYPYKNPDKKWNPSIPTLKGGEPGEYLTDRLTDEAITFVKQNQDRPFFLYLTHYAVHTPLQAPSKLVEKYQATLQGQDTGVDPVYAAMVENVDYNVGRLLQTLDQLELSDNTLVILFSDNGGAQIATNNSPLREGKGWLYEGGIRVPLIIKWPEHLPAGKVCHEPVIGTDLYPTILEATGNVIPENILDGQSLIPLWKNEKRRDRDALYWYYPHYSPKAKQPSAAIRQGDFKLIEFYDPPRLELYNLAEDLSENHNLIEKIPNKAKCMKSKLNNYLKNVNAKMHTLNPNRRKKEK